MHDSRRFPISCVIEHNLAPCADWLTRWQSVWMGITFQISHELTRFHLFIQLTIIEVLTYNMLVDPFDRQRFLRVRFSHAFL